MERNLYHLTADEREKMGIESLPADLGEAIKEAENSELLHKALGEHTFFLQAEDGIRDGHVTGVQTCALPISAGRAAGLKRFVAQSYAGWPSERTGGPVKTEDDPLDLAPPKAVRPTLEAIRYLESAVTGADWTEGVVLRYGGFYGPGTSLAPE